MSEANVEIIKRGFDAYLRGDVASATAIYADDVVFNPAEEAPIHGREAVLSYLRRWEDPWDEYELQAEEFIGAGDCVVVTIHVRARGAASGIEVDARSTRSTRCATASWFAWTSSSFATKPSMPPGCRSSEWEMRLRQTRSIDHDAVAVSRRDQAISENVTHG